jgi:hypothetical protein
MSPDHANNRSAAIEAAIADLQNRSPAARGPRQELAPYIEQLRELRRAGWTQSAIVTAFKAQGLIFSASLLRSVMHEGTPTKPKDKKSRKAATAVAVLPSLNLEAVGSDSVPDSSGEF